MCWKIQDRRHIENKQIKYNSEKANNAKYSKATYPTLVQPPFTALGQVMRWGLFYNAPEPTLFECWLLLIY